MKIKFLGEPSMLQLKQAIFEQLQSIEDDFSVHHLKSITLYFTPTDGSGNKVLCRKHKRIIEELFCDAPYQCAADDYDT